MTTDYERRVRDAVDFCTSRRWLTEVSAKQLADVLLPPASPGAGGEPGPTVTTWRLAVEGLLHEWDKLTRHGSPMAKNANEAVAYARKLMAMPYPTTPEPRGVDREPGRRCECFGDSGLHASTYVPVGSDLEHCDMCGWPVRDGAADVLTAVNASSPNARPTTAEPRGCPTPRAVTDSYPVGPAWVEAEQSMRLQNPPDGLYVVRNGIAVAVTAEELVYAMIDTAKCNPHTEWPQKIIAALSRPADGAAS